MATLTWDDGSKAEVGRGSYFAKRPTILWDRYGSKLLVGNYTSIAAGFVAFLGGNHRFLRVAQTTFDGKDGSYSNGDIVIGSDVWIGHGVKVLSGSRIGHGAVVGAYSVVRGEVEPYSIAVGNPAKVIGFRFNADQINSLLKIAWWDWTEEQVKAARDLLTSEDMDRFIESYLGA